MCNIHGYGGLMTLLLRLHLDHWDWVFMTAVIHTGKLHSPLFVYWSVSSTDHYLKRPWFDAGVSTSSPHTYTPQLTTHLSPHKHNRNSTVFVGACLLLNKPIHVCLLDHLCVFLYSAAMQSSARGNQLQSVTLSCCVGEESLHLSVLMNEDSAVWFWCKKPSSQAVDCGQLSPFHQRWKSTHTCCSSLLMRNEMSKMDHKWADFTGCCAQVCSHSMDIFIQ